MSRSTKRPYIKCGCTKQGKRKAARAYRRIVKQIVKPFRLRYWYHSDEKYCGFCECYEDGLCPFEKQSLEPEIPHRYSVTNPYDICDCIVYYPSDAGSYRK